MNAISGEQEEGPEALALVRCLSRGVPPEGNDVSAWVRQFQGCLALDSKPSAVC